MFNNCNHKAMNTYPQEEKQFILKFNEDVVSMPNEGLIINQFKHNLFMKNTTNSL